MTLDRIVGAGPTNPCVLTIEESVKINPPLITNLSLALGVGVATPIVISNNKLVKLLPGRLLTIEFRLSTEISIFCLGSR